MSHPSQCTVCGGDHTLAPGESCPVMVAAAAQGAQPRDVPVRVFGAYVEARTALKKNAAKNAAETLRWLLGYLAEERGAGPGESFAAKLQRLCDHDVIAPAVRDQLYASATGRTPEQAWALMSLVEHALFRLYLRPRRS